MSAAIPAHLRGDGTRGLNLATAAAVVFLLLFVAAPLAMVFWRSLLDRNDVFIGFANYAELLTRPALSRSIANSFWISLLTAAIVTPPAFAYAFAVTRTRMPGRAFFRLIAQLPLLAPSLLPAIALVYLFGNQGLLRHWLMGESIYGPIGVVLAEAFYVFPHAVMILIIALSTADARLYEAAESLGAGKLRRFLTITLPGARYGLISAAMVVFTLVITDFSAPKVIGGQFNVLATDIYKQVVGQQNFGMGAVVGMALLVPAVAAFIVDWFGRKKQTAQLSARAQPYRPRPDRLGDLISLLFCSLIAVFLLGMLGTAAYASFVTYWPYNLTLTLKNYDFRLADAAGWASYPNSLTLAGWTAVIGAPLIFTAAWLVERGPAHPLLKGAVRLLAILPLAVPGLVLGLAYIFFFNAPWNPLNGLYGGMAILVFCTVAHFYTVCHLTAATALKQLDAEFENVSAGLGVSPWRTYMRVTVPLCLPAILDIAIYLFVNAMTTVSAVVFLYSPATKTASVAVLNMDDAGETAAAAAMAMMIVYTSAGVRLLHAGLSHALHRRTQAWRAG
jgi:iron(III) transport system permease protein